MARLTIRAYARHRGVSHTAVRKAIASGRIVAGADGTIEPAEADQQWTETTNLSKPRNSVIGCPRSGASRVLRAIRWACPDPEAADAVNGGTQGDTACLVSSYAASRAAREAFQARLVKLEFEQRSGELVDADEVRAQVFALGRRIRDSLQGIRDRLAPILVGQSDAAMIHRLLSEEIERGLAELSKAPPIQSPSSRPR